MSEAALNRGGAPGWYGKLPTLGDFASRRLPAGFVRGWDDWLQRGLASARDELGAGWLACYLVAPIVRFWLGPGVLGARAWAGLVMPSVDRVGRHFPLTIVRPSGPLAEALAALDWYRSVDGIARRVLDVAFTVERLELALAGLVVGDAADAEIERRADALLRQHAERRCSVWWCGDAAERLRCFDGLPPPAAFAALLGEHANARRDVP